MPFGRFLSRAVGNLIQGAIQNGITGSDEDAIAEAEDEMRGMVGNAGQDAILDEAMGAFQDWAIRALESPGAFREFPEVLGLRQDKYDGTDDIWTAGYEIIAEASGNHDAADEAGEGTGDEQ